jgi:hypothetical protein
MSRGDVPDDVAAIRAEIQRFLDTKDADGRIVGNATMGIYAFYDYDGEPIYVGQTVEKLRVRIRRHLTNHRTDAVAMNVLDPFEVAEVEMWPFFDLAQADKKVVNATLGAAEFTVYQKVVRESLYGAVLNEKDIPAAEPIEMPPSVRGTIIPDSIYHVRKHADIRIARRANTIAALARVISERSVSSGLRRTLLTQARRLEHLARTRHDEVGPDASEDPAD